MERRFVRTVGPQPLNMCSSTSANTANTDSSLKRTLASSDARHGDSLQPATKRSKKETKLDRLKAEQKSEASELKRKIEAVLGLIEGKDVANEALLKIYVDSCNEIVAGMELDEDALRLFEGPFEKNFKPEEVLLQTLDPCMLPVYPCRTHSIATECSTPQ